jgi:hypothetical protein
MLLKAGSLQESNVQLKQNFGNIQVTESDITDFCKLR